jgi:hypothetical protein
MLEAIAVEAGMLVGRDAIHRALGLEPDSVRLVRAVGSSVEQLREGPYHAGREFLEAAARADADAECREIELRRARERFIDARGGLRDNPVIRSLAALHVALIEHIRGRDDEARYWAAATYEDAVVARDAVAAQLSEALGNGGSTGAPPTREWLAGAAGIVAAPAVVAGGVAVLPPLGVVVGVTYAASRAWRERRRRRAAGPARAVAELTTYVDAVGALRARLAADRATTVR